MIKCDRCGCEIHTKCTYRMMAYVTELDGKKCTAQPYEAEMEREYCDNCLTEIRDYMHNKPGTKGKSSKPAPRKQLDIGKVLKVAVILQKLHTEAKAHGEPVTLGREHEALKDILET